MRPSPVFFTIVRKENATHHEYRANGQLYMIRVQPDVGPEYYLVDQDAAEGAFRQLPARRPSRGRAGSDQVDRELAREQVGAGGAARFDHPERLDRRLEGEQLVDGRGLGGQAHPVARGIRLADPEICGPHYFPAHQTPDQRLSHVPGADKPDHSHGSPPYLM